MTYHFRVSATNVLGAGSGLDQTFTTTVPGVADLAVSLTHAGSFTQGGTGAVYTISIVNLGTAASSGTVSVVHTLPGGLTATAISGAGWTANLGTLICTRSDTLAAGAAYPPITVTVDVAANAAALVTNTASVSGGGDGNAANNTASDPTVINPSGSGSSPITLVGWDVSGLTGGTDNFGVSPLSPTTNAANLTAGGLTRGSGIGTTGNGAARGWGGNTWTNTSWTSAISSNRFVTFNLAANGGYKVSFASISRFDYRHSATGPVNGLLQYQIGSGAFADIAALAYPSNTSAGGSLSPIDLSGIAALQNVGAGTNVTFRIINWGGTSSGGTWYVFDVAGSSAPDFVVQGTVSPAVVPVADLAVDMAHTGNFTQGDTNAIYTVIVTNRGTATATGTISVADTLPDGLKATSISGAGWSPSPDALSCIRSDALAPGASYPPIILTVSVTTNAPGSVTNTVTVAGGGESNPTNNTASDPTAIVALEPIAALAIALVRHDGREWPSRRRGPGAERYAQPAELCAWPESAGASHQSHCRRHQHRLPPPDCSPESERNRCLLPCGGG